jgi:hypothetical protein
MKKLLTTSLLMLLVNFTIGFYDINASIISLTPVSDGHYYFYFDSCGLCPDVPYCEMLDCDLYEMEISNEIIVSASFMKAPGYGSERRTGIIEFNISNVGNFYNSGQMQAHIFLKAKEGNCLNLALYNIDDTQEDGIIGANDVGTTDLIEQVSMSQFSEGTIVFNVTNALEHDLYEPNQTEFSGFVLKGCDYNYVDFYDHTNPVYAPRLKITVSCVAEKIYGSNSHETELLRSIRDNILSKTQEGRGLIKLYYQWSPVIVRAMEADEEFKQEVKDMVDKILPMIEGVVE